MRKDFEVLFWWGGVGEVDGVVVEVLGLVIHIFG